MSKRPTRGRTRPCKTRKRPISKAAFRRLLVAEQSGEHNSVVRTADLHALIGEYERERGLDAAALASLQGELLPAEPRSLQQRRLRKFDRVSPERIYLAAWKLETRRNVRLGYTALDLILCPDGVRYPIPASRRDAVVAASIIQWLGTNIGGSLIRKCEAAIVKARCEDDARLTARLKTEEAERQRQRESERRRQLGPKTRAIELG